MFNVDKKIFSALLAKDFTKKEAFLKKAVFQWNSIN